MIEQIYTVEDICITEDFLDERIHKEEPQIRTSHAFLEAELIYTAHS